MDQHMNTRQSGSLQRKCCVLFFLCAAYVMYASNLFSNKINTNSELISISSAKGERSLKSYEMLRIYLEAFVKWHDRDISCRLIDGSRCYSLWPRFDGSLNLRFEREKRYENSPKMPLHARVYYRRNCIFEKVSHLSFNLRHHFSRDVNERCEKNHFVYEPLATYWHKLV